MNGSKFLAPTLSGQHLRLGSICLRSAGTLLHCQASDGPGTTVGHYLFTEDLLYKLYKYIYIYKYRDEIDEP
jgi:hypothetical protein